VKSNLWPRIGPAVTTRLTVPAIAPAVRDYSGRGEAARAPPAWAILIVRRITREDGMTRRLLTLGFLVLALAACEDRREKAIQKISHDEEILKKASAAVNEVIRNSPDCSVAKPLIPEAYQKIEDARKQVSAPATQATLDALKVQVDRIAQVCP
jgi:hypothetical protein